MVDGTDNNPKSDTEPSAEDDWAAAMAEQAGMKPEEVEECFRKTREEYEAAKKEMGRPSR